MGAFGDYFVKREKYYELNKAVLATLPENPERGSYYWWAGVCRQYTGQHHLDSGIAYGYQFNAPIPPEDSDHVLVRVNTWTDAVEISVSINTIAWLTAHTDANDPIAIALENLLYMLGDEYPDEPWHETVERFLNDLHYIVERSEVLEELNVWPDDLQEVSRRPSGFLTYNHDNDLSQDFNVYAILTDGTDYWAIISTHNGCDIRGGYSSPRVALVRSIDYFYDWAVDFYCMECSAGLDDKYYYGEALSKSNDELQGVRVISDYEQALDVQGQLASGQLAFDAPTWPYAIDPDDARALVKHYYKWLEEYDSDDDYQLPVALLETNDGVIALDEHAAPASKVRFRCPKCGRYSVVAGSCLDY